MITLHHKKEIDFSKNGYGDLSNYIIKPEVSWELNGEFSINFEYPIFSPNSQYLKDENIVRAPVPYMDDQLFRIYRPVERLGYIQITARHIFYDLVDNFIEDTNIVGKNGVGALTQLLNATQYPHRFNSFSDISRTTNMRVIRYNPVKALLDDSEDNTFVNRWGGEVLRDNFNIHMRQRLGSNRGVRIEYKKDLLGIEATIDYSTVATRILPKGFDGLLIPEKYVNSALLDTESPKIRMIEYPEVKAAIGDYADDEDALPLEQAYAELRRLATAEYSEYNIDEPEAVIHVDFVTLENTKEYESFKELQEIHQGDTVKVSIPEQDFEVTSRLVAFKSDPLRKNHYLSTTLGNHVTEFTTARTEIDIVRKELKETNELITIARQAANGKNTNYWGTVDPNTIELNAQLNDTYFQEDGDYFAIWEYVEVNGERYWRKGPNTDFGKEIANQLQEAIELVEEAKQQAVASKQEAIDEAERLVTEQDTVYQELFDGYDAAVDDLTQGVAAADGKASDALTQAGESQSLAQSATEGVERVERTLTAVSNKTDDAFSKADNALIKANNIPSTIDGVITDKGLVSGDWVTTKINEETGEINYALESVRGDVPDVVMGVTWDKEESPILTRTDYVEEFANLNDYELQSAEFRLSVEGLGMDLADVQRDKLDSSVFTTFKTNEYTNDIDGIRQRLTSAEENKLDGNTFQTFKEHDYQVTVAGLSGDIEKLEREKLDGDEFTNFKSNEYQLTVDGFEMALTDVSGAVPNLVLGVEWDRTESPRMERTDYTKELDLTNYAAPDYVLGVEWDRKENPLMVRTHDTQESTSKEEFELFLADYSFRADGWDATNSYITENTTAINSLINNAFGWSQTISYVDENQTKFNDTVSQVDFYKQTIGSDAENLAQLVMTDEAFITRVGQLEGMAEDIILGVEWDKGSDPAMARTGYMDDWTETQVAQLADSWSMNLKSNGDVVTAINATEDGVRILGRNIILDGDTLVTGNFAVSGDHVILDADTQVRGDFTVSGSNVILNAQTTVMGDFKVLGGNVTLDGDTTVHGDFSVFGKNIILDGDTTVQGTFKVTDTMIAPNAEIDGAKIADATIGSAKIANLDVSKISGNTAEFVTAGFNGVSSWMQLDSDGIHMSRSGSWRRTYITPTGFDLYNGLGGGNKAGAIGYFKPSGSEATYDENVMGNSVGAKHMVGIGVNASHDIVLGYNDDSSTNRFFKKALQVDGDTGRIRVYRPISPGTSGYNVNLTAHDGNPHYGMAIQSSTAGIMFATTGTHIWDYGANVWDKYDMTTRQRIGFYGNSGIQVLTSNKIMGIWAGGSSVDFYTSTNNHRFRISDGSITAYTDLNMSNHQIFNQSDSRLKTNVTKTNDDSLEKIMNIEFVDFNWLSSGEDDFGIIAQQVQLIAPELIAEGDDGYLGINNTRLNMMTVHAVKELALREINTNKIASQALQSAETNEQKIERLEKRIEELEGVM